MLGAIASRLPRGRVTVLAPAAEKSAGVKILRLPARSQSWKAPALKLAGWLSPSLSKVLAYLPATLAAIRSEEPEVLQCGHLQLGPLTWAASRWTRVPYVVYAYGDELLPRFGQFRGRFGDLLTRAVLRRASAVITISEFTRRLVLQRGVPDARIARVPVGTGVPTPVSRERQQELLAELGAMGRPLVLSVGRLIPQKGHDRLLRSFPRILAEHPRATCVIVGQGPDEKELRELAGGLGVEDRVRITGFVSEEHLEALYEACDVFVLLSRDLSAQRKVEGFGLVFLEAGARGKPVIGGATGGVQDAIVDGVTGLLVDPEDVEQIVGALLDLLGDPLRARRMGEAGCARVQREMNWDRCTDEVAAILRRVASSP